MGYDTQQRSPRAPECQQTQQQVPPAPGRQVTVIRGGQQPAQTQEPTTQPPSEAERQRHFNDFLLALDAAFDRLLSRVDAAFRPYNTAYVLHKGSLDRRALQIQATRDFFLNILFVGLAGGAGGTIQQVLRGTSARLTRNGGAVGAGDIAKFEVRDASGENRRTTDPEAAGGDTPELWIRGVTSDILAQRAELKERLRAVNANGLDLGQLTAMRTELEVFNRLAQVQPPQHYSLEMWREWLRRHLEMLTSREQLSGFLIEYRPLLREMSEQVGPDGQALLLAMTCRAAMDGPANRDSLGRRVDSRSATCADQSGGPPAPRR